MVLRTMQVPIVKTESGKVLGKICTNIRGGPFFSFYGIPFAKPPVGQLRFKAPQPPVPWSGILDATQNKKKCCSRDVFKKIYVGDEDCLVLNIYVSQVFNNRTGNTTLKPVIFIIHGGGFITSSNSTVVYGPEILMTEDIVLVVTNYRLGIFGFLSLDDPDLEVPGNAGFKDMVMALKWVKINIKYFGGDPNNVTIGGNSAGGAAVHYLILSPMAKGLFHKAILQSGCALSHWSRGRKLGKELPEILNLNTTNEREILRQLQFMSARKLFEVSEKFKDMFVADFQRPYGAVIENISSEAFLTDEPLNILKSGRYNHVPVLISYTNREGLFSEIGLSTNLFISLSDFERTVPYFLNLKKGSDISKLVASKIKEFYYGNEEPSDDNKDNFYLLETDNLFVRDILRSLRYHVQTSSTPVYLYRMSLETGLNIGRAFSRTEYPGVMHGDDNGYLYKTKYSPDIEEGSIEDISARMFTKLWSNFARYGDPNPKERDSLIDVNWKPVTKNEINFMDIDKELTVGVNPEAERMAFWDEILKINFTNKL